MPKEKKIRILIEVPENWIDIESPTLFAGRSIYDIAVREVKDAVINQYLKKIKLPAIKITQAELKKAVLEHMASEAAKKYDTNED